MHEDLVLGKNFSPSMLGALLASPPLSYFWAVEYWDGTAVSQFHPDTGLEMMWSKVFAANKRVKRVLWLPFGEPFAKKVFAKTGIVCRLLPQDRMMEAIIPEGAKIFLKRKQHLALGIRSGHTLHERAYILGFSLNGNVEVMARDSYGRNVNPHKVAKWVKSMSATDGKGKLEDKEQS